MRNCILLFYLAFFSCSVFATNAISLQDLVNPGSITLDENQMYITEGTSIYIYSLPGVKLLKKFGKRGEGPQELLPPFGRHVHIDVLPNELMVISGFRLSFFTKQGSYIKEVKIPSTILTNRYIRKIGAKFIGSTQNWGRRDEKHLIMIAYNIYDSNQKIIKEIYRTRRGLQVLESEIQYNPLYVTVLEPTLYVFDGKIFLGHYGPNEKGVIYVFDSNGKKLYDIKPEYEKIIFTEKHKEAFKKEYVTQAQKDFYKTHKHLFKYSGYFPERQWFQVVDKKIYIQTYKKNKSGNMTEFLILDLKGKLLTKLMLPLKYSSYFYPYLYSIKKGKLYQISEDDDEEWEVHIIKIE
jgi:hypothetical protein